MKTQLAVLIGSTVLIGNGVSPARADHDCRRYHLNAFEAANRQLNRELERTRDVLRYNFEDQRDAIHAEIRHIEARYRKRQRADAIRVLHRELARVDRAYHRDIRGLHEQIEDRRRELIHQRDDALRRCRTGRCTQACFVEPHAPHHIEHIPPPTLQPVPSEPHLLNFDREVRGQDGISRWVPSTPHVLHRNERNEHPRGQHADRLAPRSEFDWQGLVLELLARRVGR